MKCNPQSVAVLEVLVAAKYSGINSKVSFLFVDSVRYNLTSCFIKVEKSDDKASRLTDAGTKSWNGSYRSVLM